MTKKITYIFTAILGVSLLSCTFNASDATTYFGGKIINPKSKYVVIYSMDKVLDTLYLDARNKFLGTFDSAKEGLYYFVHGAEHQYFYLEPQDSLLVRLNTWDFDESLVFAGKGAERNNILIDCFLEDEIDTKKFRVLTKLEPTLFKKKTDSLLRLKRDTYNNYVQNHPNETKGFQNILNITLTYPIYARLESYPTAYAQNFKQTKFIEIDSDFYDFRKEIRMNKDSLMYYYPYSNYIKHYLYNTTYSLGHTPMSNEYSTNFTVDLLKIIVQKISSSDSKNAFLKQTLIGHFYKKSSCSIDEKPFTTFFELSSNEKDKDQVKLLLSDSKHLKKHQELVDFSISDFNNNLHPIKDIVASRNTLLFFWNPAYFSKSYIASRVKYLSNTFPEVQFLLIKMDGDNSDKIDQLDIKQQFFINKNNSANSFLSSKMPRGILIDKKGKIVNGFASISSTNIHSQLKEFSYH